MKPKKIAKSIRLNPELRDKIHSFMESARVMSAEEEEGKKTISNNMTKAIWYLFLSYFDHRRFVDRGLFSGCLSEIANLNATLNTVGNKLNDLNRSLHSKQTPALESDILFKELREVIAINANWLEKFKKSYVAIEKEKNQDM